MSTQVKKVTLPSFYRDNTPLIVFPITINGVAAALSGYTAYLTLTTDSNPANNTDAFFHKAITTDATGTLINPQTGQSFGPNFNYQFTNADTANLDPTKTYYWDIKVEGPTPNTALITLASGTFKPWTNFGRGLS